MAEDDTPQRLLDILRAHMAECHSAIAELHEAGVGLSFYSGAAMVFMPSMPDRVVGEIRRVTRLK